MKNIMSDERINQFIDGVVCTKTGVMKCCNVLLKKEECVFDEISMITTFNSENDGGQCKEDEIMIRMAFPGYEEEVVCLKYIEFLSLVQQGIEKNINYYSLADRKEIEDMFSTIKTHYYII